MAFLSTEIRQNESEFNHLMILDLESQDDFDIIEWSDGTRCFASELPNHHSLSDNYERVRHGSAYYIQLIQGMM